MKLLEACAGENQSWSKAGRALGYECLTLDWNKRIAGIDFYEDVRTFAAEERDTDYDVICCSPDCREISRARSKKGDHEFSDEVGWACVQMCLRAAARGAIGIIENPQGALERRPFMREYEGLKHTVDYCMWSGERPIGYVPGPAGKQYLGDWFPMRKRTNIWVFGSNCWMPTRSLCSRCTPCDWMVDRVHLAWAQHAPPKEQAEQCRRHCLPYALNTAQLHRIPFALCAELIQLTGLRSNKMN